MNISIFFRYVVFVNGIFDFVCYDFVSVDFYVAVQKVIEYLLLFGYWWFGYIGGWEWEYIVIDGVNSN